MRDKTAKCHDSVQYWIWCRLLYTKRLEKWFREPSPKVANDVFLFIPGYATATRYVKGVLQPILQTYLDGHPHVHFQQGNTSLHIARQITHKLSSMSLSWCFAVDLNIINMCGMCRFVASCIQKIDSKQRRV